MITNNFFEYLLIIDQNVENFKEIFKLINKKMDKLAKKVNIIIFFHP